MCLGRQRTPDPTPMAQPAPTMARINPTKQSELPTKKDLVDPDDIQGVEYGTTRKKQTPAAGKKPGTSALRIPLSNTAQGAGSGGVNV